MSVNNMDKYFKHFVLNSAHQLGILRSAHYFDSSNSRSLYVLVYHRVDWENSQPRLDPNNLSATPEQFEQHMRLISSEYHPVSADNLLESILYNKSLPTRAVLVTVDDGYCDFKKYIWPIANRYGIRPVLFVPTAYVGSGVFWWDQLYDALQRTTLEKVDTPVGTLSLNNMLNRQSAFAQIAQYMKKSPFNLAFTLLGDLCQELVSDPFSADRVTLDWDDLRELSKAGVTVAPHTHTHPALGNVSLEQARFEVSESQRLIMTEIGSLSNLFAYPYGSRNSIGTVAGEILRESDCQLAFTMNPGRAHLDYDDHMYLPRIESNVRLTIAQFHAKLNPFFDLLTRKKQAAL
jgi:peptidoglycan/xylan/chitin deacetylase (PgdA/CDA1 family)